MYWRAFMKLMIINGPNLNMLGIREKNIYGVVLYDKLVELISSWCKEKNVECEIYQSNHEGDLVDKIQEAYFCNYEGIIINPGAYTHTSIAILDALKATNLPTIEVHISDINNREEFRKKSYIRDYCFMSIIGQGIEGYHIAINEMIKKIKEK